MCHFKSVVMQGLQKAVTYNISEKHHKGLIL